MVLLPDQDRNRIWRYFMRHNTTSCAFTKAELRAAIDAIDAWIEDNAADFNTSLPVAFRTSATPTQKTALLCWVATRRAGLLHVEEDG